MFIPKQCFFKNKSHFDSQVHNMGREMSIEMEKIRIEHPELIPVINQFVYLHCHTKKEKRIRKWNNFKIHFEIDN